MFGSLAMETAVTPGILTSLPGRYAKALFDLAQDKTQVESVGSSLHDLEKVLQSSKQLRQILANPTLQEEEQVAVLTDICTQLEVPEILTSFAIRLFKAGRVSYLSQIGKIYQSLASQAKGERRIEVVSAYPLTASQGRLLKENLKRVYPETLNLIFVQDARVLGGVLIRAGSQVIDATLVTQLNKLATVMKGSI